MLFYIKEFNTDVKLSSPLINNVPVTVAIFIPPIMIYFIYIYNL